MKGLSRPLHVAGPLIGDRQKIAFIATVYRHLANFHIPFMKQLIAMGYEVHAYAAPDDGKDEILSSARVICHDVMMHRNPFHWMNIRALKVLVTSFKEQGFLFVHVHTPVASVLSRVAAKVSGVRLVFYTAHGFHFFSGAPWRNWIFYYPVERALAGWTDIIFTINSEDFVRARKFGVRHKVVRIPGVGVDPVEFSPVKAASSSKSMREQLGLEEKDFVILNVAEINSNKNQIQLIKAVHNLIRMGHSVHCLLAGTGKDESFLKSKVRQLKLEHYIHFLGFRRDICSLMYISDVLCLLSKREGLPKSLLEGLVSGKPLIITDVRGSRDLVKDGENGFVVPVGDIDTTTMAFQKLIENLSLRRQMGLISLKKAEQYYSPRIHSIMVSTYLRAIEVESLSLGGVIHR